MTAGHIMGVEVLRADRKQRQFESREYEIMTAALELCSCPNWETVSVEQIAQHAGVAKGTVYSHFCSKDELLFRLTLDFYQGLLVELQDLDGSGDPASDFRSIIDRSLRYHLEHREYRYILEYCCRVDFKDRADETLKQEFRRLDEGFKGWCFQQVEVGMAAGVFERRPSELVVLGLHACYEGAIQLLRAGPEWCSNGDDETIIRSATEFMLAGLIGQQPTSIS